MNLNHARYLLTIEQEKSISAAAKKLYITQSALSQTVRQVEKELGAPIFTRVGGRLQLSCAGKLYLDTARAMLQLEKNLHQEVGALNPESSGLLRFGVPVQQGILLLPALLCDFWERFPNVDVEIEERGSLILAEQVIHGTLDLALVRTAQHDPELIYEPIQRERTGILAGENTSLYRELPDGTEIPFLRAVKEDFVFLRTGHNARTIQDMLCRQYAVQLKKIVELDTFETAKRVAQRCGAAILSPYSVLKNDVRLFETMRFYPLLDTDRVQTTNIIMRRDRILTQYAKEWIALVRAFYLEE